MISCKRETDPNFFSKLTWGNDKRFYAPGLGNPKLLFARGPILLLDACNKKGSKFAFK